MIKVAGYCRVSTDKEDQANSFETQKRYFRDYIQRHPQWELYEIYADEGITGTTTKKRTQFNRMIADAYEGKFRLILTKEVSRFSRNILDTIAYTRELRSMGIGVFFLTDRINTLEPEGEMLLSYLAAMAQEESRRTSARVVWGQTRQMEKGVVFGQSLLGYDVKEGVLSIEPEGAQIVRLIFHQYALEQRGASEIARYLTRQGYRTSRGGSQWTANGIVKILRNEKYAGDLIQKKTYTPDYLTHAKKANNGNVPLVVLRDHHEPIVPREVWELAQERLRKNNKHGDCAGGHSNRYVFSGKIRCGECGSSFVGRFKYQKNGSKIRRWSCGTAAREGADRCNVGKLLRDDDALQMLNTALRSLSMDTDAIIRNVTTVALGAIREGELGANDAPAKLQREMDRIHRKKEAVLDSCFSGDISREDMLRMNDRYDHQLQSLQQRQQQARQRWAEHGDLAALGETIASELQGILQGEIPSDVFSRNLAESITVFKDRHMELRLQHLPQVFWFDG